MCNLQVKMIIQGTMSTFVNVNEFAVYDFKNAYIQDVAHSSLQTETIYKVGRTILSFHANFFTANFKCVLVRISVGSST